MAGLNRDIVWTPEMQNRLIRKNYTQVNRKDLRPKEYCLYQGSDASTQGSVKTFISVHLRPEDESMFS